jgi:cell division protein FtsI (penicillin-binding protein 3)
MAYGYSVELSPLQILTFYNGIANDGKMITPLFVKEIRDEGKTIEAFETRVIKNSMCDAATLKGIKDCLHDVVWNNDLGTASISPWGVRKAQSELVSIAGKTGTAQVLESGYQNKKHRMSFVGYFPEENPQYTYVFMYDTGKRIYGALNGAGDSKNCFLVETLEEAVALAKKVTARGNACVMSPAAPSYGVFKNFEERGEKFKEYVMCECM